MGGSLPASQSVGKAARQRADTQPRVVLVTRPTEREQLLARHATKQQAEFFLQQRARKMDDVEVRHQNVANAQHDVLGGIPADWRRARVTRADLDRFLFEPGDVVVALGPDGLVANVAKYLTGQPVIGLNPDRAVFEGVLVRHPPESAADLIRTAVAGRGEYEERTMVEATLEDGQRLLALNEIFVGHRTHQSARYALTVGGRTERQSSSGLIVATGTGATGWTRSITRERKGDVALPAPTDRRLAFFVREAWPSVATGTSLTQGLLAEGETLAVQSELEEEGTVFGDGIESDRLEFGFGRIVSIRVAETRLRLMQG